MTTAFDSVRVALGDHGYDILVGRGLLADAGRHLVPVLPLPRVLVVTDRTVAAAHLAVLSQSLDAAGIAHDHVVLTPGEQTKSFARFENLVESLLAKGVERATTLVALGGGVVGDVTGFAASVLLRGIGYVQVPTTLLAQVDSAVGGKTGINTRHGKNLVGAFHQPLLVLADTGTLDTLPRRQLLAGYAEVVKYGLLGDAKFFAWLETHGASVIEGGDDERRHAVVRSCQAKAAIVAGDEREAGQRALLNLGHTFAHALEADIGYSEDLLHGEAVAIGMVLAFELSARLGHCPAAEVDRVRHHLASVGLPIDLRSKTLSRREWSPDRLLQHMRQDKKVRGGQVTFVLTRGIGEAFLSTDVDTAIVREVLCTAIAK